VITVEDFDKFVHADYSLKKQYEGTGLGLSIVRRLIELLWNIEFGKTCLNEDH
jgi:signal transduction histidine kinase